jgi:integrase
MKIKFYLKRAASKNEKSHKPISKKPTSIFALANYNGNKLKIYTQESILTKHWNPEKQMVNASHHEHSTFNLRLNKISNTILQTFQDFKNKNDNYTPTPSILKPLIELALKKGGKKITLLSYWQDFANRTINGVRNNPRTQESIKGTGGRGYITTLNHLKEFNKRNKRVIDFDTIDLGFHADFIEYLTSPSVNLATNSVGSHIQRIKAVMSEAFDKKLTSNDTFKSKRFVKPTEEADTIYLNDAELKEMQELDLSNNPRLDNVRDLFLIGCYTALRFSDLSALRSKNIADGLIRIKQIKTGKPVIIPVHSVVKVVLRKYDGNTPRPISNVKMNLYLKELGQLMPSLKKNETKTITKGGNKVTVTMQKWELLTTHTARRSMATNEYKRKVIDVLQIMSITGHTTEKAFLKYIRVTPEEHANDIAKLWEKYENKLKIA